MTVSKPETVEVTQADRDAAADFMFECAPYLGDCAMKNSVELALRQHFKRHRLNATPSRQDGLREALEMARPYVEGSHDDGCEMHFEYGEENFDDDAGARFWPEDRKCTCGHDDVLASIDAALSDTPPPDNEETEALRGEIERKLARVHSSNRRPDLPVAIKVTRTLAQWDALLTAFNNGGK